MSFNCSEVEFPSGNLTQKLIQKPSIQFPNVTISSLVHFVEQFEHVMKFVVNHKLRNERKTRLLMSINGKQFCYS